MAKKFYEEGSVQAIADAIRAKNGSSDKYTIAQMSAAISELSGGYGSIPMYHYAEAGRLISNIRTFKSAHPNSLIFGAVSDMHVFNADAEHEDRAKTAMINAGFALEIVGAAAQCDFVANLGDLCWENGIDTANAYIGAQFAVNALRNAFERLPSVSIPGNHDKTDSTQKQYDLIGIYNDLDVYSDTLIRGFGYKDYADKRVRVICLNTNDYLNASGGCALSYEQKDFLLRALDLSEKSDCASWQILLLSHIPLDWNGGDYNFYTDLQTVLTAYEEGTTASITVNSSYAKNETPSEYATYSSGNLVYDYSGKNSAKIIANIHGHVHTNKASKIANTSIARVATVNANPDLNKTESYSNYGDYSITSAEAAEIVKVSGTAKDTAATFYCIDLDEQIIYAYGYGADVDRTIIYKDANVYTISYDLTMCSVSISVAAVVEGTQYVTSIIPTDADGAIKSVVVTMGGVDITSSCYSSGTIIISEVTGDVVITAVAEVPLVSETITPHLAPRSTWYGQLDNGVLKLGASVTEAALGVADANDYVYTDRNGAIFYLMPINSKYCRATIDYSATDGLAVQYYFQAIKDNGGTFTSVAASRKTQTTTFVWDKGAADYLLISIEHTDGTTKWDWSSTGVTCTVTFANQ